MMDVETARGGGSGSRARSRLRARTRAIHRTVKNRLKAWEGLEDRSVRLTWMEKRELRLRVEGLQKGRAKGRVWGLLTAKQVRVYLAVLDAHNGVTGACYPSYEWIEHHSEAGHSTIAKSLDVLESFGLIVRIKRVRRRRPEDRGNAMVVQASNAYRFTRPAHLPSREHMATQAILRDTAPVDRPPPVRPTSPSPAPIDDSTVWPRSHILFKESYGLKLNPELLASIPDAPDKGRSGFAALGGVRSFDRGKNR